MAQTLAQDMLDLAVKLPTPAMQDTLSRLAVQVARLERTLDELARDGMEDAALTFEAVRTGKATPLFADKQLRRPQFGNDDEAQMRLVESVTDGSAPRGDGAA